MPHHTGKTGDQRGTSAREDNIDNSVILLKPLDYVPEDGAKFICHFKKSRVRTAELNQIADCQFQLTIDENGQLVWTWGSTKTATKLEVLRLLDEGQKQNDVASIVGVHKGTVSRIRKQAIKDGQITPKNKLTQSGCKVVYGDEN